MSVVDIRRERERERETFIREKRGLTEGQSSIKAAAYVTMGVAKGGGPGGPGTPNPIPLKFIKDKTCTH